MLFIFLQNIIVVAFLRARWKIICSDRCSHQKDKMVSKAPYIYNWNLLVKHTSKRDFYIEMAFDDVSMKHGLNICLNHLARVTHIFVGKLIITGSDNGLSPMILLIGLLGTNFSEIRIKIHNFSFKKIQLKMSSGKWWPFCLGPNVLILFLLVSAKGGSVSCFSHGNRLTNTDKLYG